MTQKKKQKKTNIITIQLVLVATTHERIFNPLTDIALSRVDISLFKSFSNNFDQRQKAFAKMNDSRFCFSTLSIIPEVFFSIL